MIEFTTKYIFVQVLLMKIKLNTRAICELGSIYGYISNDKSAPENANWQIDRLKKLN